MRGSDCFGSLWVTVVQCVHEKQGVECVCECSSCCGHSPGVRPEQEDTFFSTGPVIASDDVFDDAF